MACIKREVREKPWVSSTTASRCGWRQKAEGRQSLAYGHRPEEARAGLDGRPGSARNGPPGAEGLQEGPEKEAFVDGPGRRLMVGEVGVETGQSAGAGAVPVTEHARQMSPRRCAGRDGVDLAVLEELQAVLDGPQEPVGRGEALGIGAGHVPARCQGGQRAQGARGPQSLVLAAVHQLEQLDGELDVAYAAPSQLYLPLCEPVAGHRLFGPGLHGRSERRSSVPRGRPHTRLAASKAKADPSSWLPAAGRAFRRAWNSHVSAQRSQ